MESMISLNDFEYLYIDNNKHIIDYAYLYNIKQNNIKVYKLFKTKNNQITKKEKHLLTIL